MEDIHVTGQEPEPGEAVSPLPEEPTVAELLPVPLPEAEGREQVALETAAVQEAEPAEEAKPLLIRITKEELAKPIVIRIPDDEPAPIRIRLTDN